MGRRKGSRKSEIDYVSRHGEVVAALHKIRENSLETGSKIIKNVYIDLGVTTNGVLSELYEVKTSSSRSDIYTAIGQLFIHNSGNECKLSIVLPNYEPLGKELANGLKRYQIEVIYYELTDESVNFK